MMFIKYGEQKIILREYEILLALHQELDKEQKKYFPKVYGWESLGEKSCLYLEKLEGQTLSELVFKTGKKVTKDIFLLWMEQTAEGLCALHQMRPAVLWCDCKPSNLMFVHGQIKLIDFNASLRLKDMIPIQCYGTEDFAAPEQKENGSIDERTDLYQYGMTFLALNQRMFQVRIQRLLKHCISEQKEQRVQTAAELLYEIRRIKQTKGSI